MIKMSEIIEKWVIQDCDTLELLVDGTTDEFTHDIEKAKIITNTSIATEEFNHLNAYSGNENYWLTPLDEVIEEKATYTEEQKGIIEKMVKEFNLVHSRKERVERLHWYDLASGIKDIAITKKIMKDINAI